jgi:ribosomal protein S18 acetylase RimI-like enzyme
VQTDAVLDNVTWAALTGPQKSFGEFHGRAARFQPDVAPFTAMDDTTDPEAWRDLVTLVGEGKNLFVAGPRVKPPPGWERVGGLAGVQMADAGVAGEDDPAAVLLGPADVPEMLDLVRRTEPGPFEARTVELGTYLGIRDGGRLVAMAGERLKVPGWTEVSAVCTDPDHRGRGLAARLIRAVVAGIQERGERPYLHAASFNAGAIKLYERLGFAVRTPVIFGAYAQR